MRREITGVTLTLTETRRGDIKVWTQRGGTPREYTRISSTFLNFHHFRPQVQSENRTNLNNIGF